MLYLFFDKIIVIFKKSYKSHFNQIRGYAMAEKCYLCNVVQGGGSFIPSKIIATWDTYWKEIEKETKEMYSDLGINASEITLKTKTNFANKGGEYYVCQQCMNKYLFGTK
jgi:hypothetical protein